MTEHERDTRNLRALMLRDRGRKVKEISKDVGLSMGSLFKLFKGATR